jgi:hypothetical protein
MCGWSMEGEDMLVLADGFEAHLKDCRRQAIRSQAGAHTACRGLPRGLSPTTRAFCQPRFIYL